MVGYADLPPEEKRRVYQSRWAALPKRVPRPPRGVQRDDLVRAWRLGWLACDEALPTRACPFGRLSPQESAMRRAWLQGYEARGKLPTHR